MLGSGESCLSKAYEWTKLRRKHLWLGQEEQQADSRGWQGMMTQRAGLPPDSGAEAREGARREGCLPEHSLLCRMMRIEAAASLWLTYLWQDGQGWGPFGHPWKKTNLYRTLLFRCTLIWRSLAAYYKQRQSFKRYRWPDPTPDSLNQNFWGASVTPKSSLRDSKESKRLEQPGLLQSYSSLE